MSLLDCDQVEPGEWGLAQLFLEEPVTTVWGQPFVLRDSSAKHTLGGGQVLQPVAGKIRRRHLESLERIEQLWSDDAGRSRCSRRSWFGGFHGFAPADLVRGAGVGPDDSRPARRATRSRPGKLVELTLPPQPQAAPARRPRRRTGGADPRRLASAARREPADDHARPAEGAGAARLRRRRRPGPCRRDRLIAAKKLVGDARRIARADFKPKLSANQRKLKDKIVEAHVAAGFQPPEPKELRQPGRRQRRGPQGHLRGRRRRGLPGEGDGRDLSARGRRRRRCGGESPSGSTIGPGATVAEIRDLLGTTRKYAVPLCEYLDRIGLTRRDGDLRVLAASR